MFRPSFRAPLLGLSLVAVQPCLATPPFQADTPPPANLGPSFPCRLKTPDALAATVCSDPTLSRLDLAFVQAYKALRQQEGDTGAAALRKEAVAFTVAVRLACNLPGPGEPVPAITPGIVGCVSRRYQAERREWLSQLKGGALEEATRPLEEHVALQGDLAQSAGLSLPANGPDGVYGPATRAAISAWQQKKGIPVNGLMTDRTADSLSTVASSDVSGTITKLVSYGTEIGDIPVGACGKDRSSFAAEINVSSKQPQAGLVAWTSASSETVGGVSDPLEICSIHVVPKFDGDSVVDTNLQEGGADQDAAALFLAHIAPGSVALVLEQSTASGDSGFSTFRVYALSAGEIREVLDTGPANINSSIIFKGNRITYSAEEWDADRSTDHAHAPHGLVALTLNDSARGFSISAEPGKGPTDTLASDMLANALAPGTVSAAELVGAQKAAQEADSPGGPIVPSGSSESFGTRYSEDVTPSCSAVLANRLCRAPLSIMFALPKNG